MLGKVYEPKQTFRKKKRRPFPKEVVNEAQANKDELFDALFADKIKEVKQKTLKQKKAENVKDKISGRTAVPPVSNPPSSRVHESEDSEESSFDKLLRAPTYQHVHYVTLKPKAVSSKLKDITNENKTIKRKNVKCTSTRKGKGDFSRSQYTKTSIRSDNENLSPEVTRDTTECREDTDDSPPCPVSKSNIICSSQGSKRANELTSTPATTRSVVESSRMNLSPITPLQRADTSRLEEAVCDGMTSPDVFASAEIGCSRNRAAWNINKEFNNKTRQNRNYYTPDPFESFSEVCFERIGVNTRRGPMPCEPFYTPKSSSSAGGLSCCRKTRNRSSVTNKSSARRSFVKQSHTVVPADSPKFVDARPSAFRDIYLGSASLLLSQRTSIQSDESEEVELEFTARDVVLARCGQADVLPFAEAFPDSCLVDCKKLGEGVYGEVFSCARGEGAHTVLKIMPIEGDLVVNGEVQKTFADILSEIVIAMELSNLRSQSDNNTISFNELVRCWCVKGPYTPKLIELWDQYHNERGSDNDSPEDLPDDQLYIVLELSNGGNVLETYQFSTADQSMAAFQQVAYALAVAEAALEFEHRDLHWGNILLRPTKSKTVRCKLLGKEHFIPCKGIQVSVIDFTLSRMTYDGCCIFNNLADDPELFEGKGDYQFDIYRLMQDKLENNWKLFEPYTNVLWLNYILDKLITKAKYSKRMNKTHRKGMKNLKDLKDKILFCSSAGDVTNLL